MANGSSRSSRRAIPGPGPLCGSSEIRLGHLGAECILIAIAPWHGDQVVVCLLEREHWKRVVLEDRMEKLRERRLPRRWQAGHHLHFRFNRAAMSAWKPGGSS
jgi:hypothetical protein